MLIIGIRAVLLLSRQGYWRKPWWELGLMVVSRTGSQTGQVVLPMKHQQQQQQLERTIFIWFSVSRLKCLPIDFQ